MTELRKVSYSQYSMWATCPHQWKLSYHDKLKPDDSSIHLIFGTAIHETIQAWLDKHYNDTKTMAAVFDTDTLFKESLIRLFKEETLTLPDGTKGFVCDQATLMEFYLDGIAIINAVRKNKETFFPSSGHELVGIEIPLEVMLTPGIRYVGFIDIVIRNKKTGRITIFDLKTSSRGWFYEKKDPKKLNQLLLYKKFYSDVYGVNQDDIDVQFLILKRKLDEKSEWVQKRVVAFDPSQGNPSVKKAVTHFTQFITDTFNPDGTVRVENLKPTPSDKACRFCPFKARKDLCPSGV
jgi:hypothetical protein